MPAARSAQLVRALRACIFRRRVGYIRRPTGDARLRWNREEVDIGAERPVRPSPDPHFLLKLMHYPRRAGDHDRQGVGAQRDSGFLTLVLQDDRGGSGLQFFDGVEFIEVLPQRGVFVINLGEALELATALGRAYISVPFFFNPRFDYVVKPLEVPAHILAPSADDVPVDRGDPIFAEYDYNALKGRLRSHRDVAERFYGDIRQLLPA